MEDRNLQEQIDAINRKLDVILEEIELQRRHRRELDDLKGDLMRVGKDAYQTALVELDDVHDYVKTGDVWHLVKKLLRNINTLSKMFEQLESWRDFIRDAAPLARESFIDFMNTLDEFDRKGYFAFAREVGTLADNVVTSFSPDDVKALSNNIVSILNTIRNMTQPDMLHAMNNAVNIYKKLDFEVEEDISLMALLKELNSPETRRGLAYAIRVLKGLARTNGTQPSHA